MKFNATSFAASFLVTSMAYLSPAMAGDMLPAEVKQGSVRYVTGGVGADAAAAFKQAAAKYPLELLFAQKAAPNDVYLAGVKVTVRQSGKVLLNADSGGPFLLAHLPPGKYQVEASSEGVTKQQTVDIQPGRHQRVVFVWNEPVSAGR